MSGLAKWLPAALAFSVLLNVFALAWVGVRIARRHGPNEHHESAMSGAAHHVWEEHAPRIRAERRAVEERRDAVAEVLRREPFDPAAFDARLRELRTASSERDAELHRALAELAGQLTPEERQRLSRSRLLTSGGMAGPARRGGDSR